MVVFLKLTGITVLGAIAWHDLGTNIVLIGSVCMVLYGAWRKVVRPVIRVVDQAVDSYRATAQLREDLVTQITALAEKAKGREDAIEANVKALADRVRTIEEILPFVRAALGTRATDRSQTDGQDTSPANS